MSFINVIHEDAPQIQLDLETHIHIGAIDGRWPPQSKTSIPNLIQTWTLSIQSSIKFLYFMDSSNPEAFSQKIPYQMGK